MAPTETPYEQAEGDSLKPGVMAKSAPPVMVHVVAPATLPAGYAFEAQIGNDPEKTFAVEVPDGGVKEGETFLAPLPEGFDIPCIKAPTGYWKDGLFDCCKLGPCHPNLCCSLWCTQVAMGQIMQRTGLTWLGVHGPEEATKNTFKVVLALVVGYTIYSTALELSIIDIDDPTSIPPLVSLLKLAGSILFSVWSIYALCRTRENVRAKYSIPEERCHGCEDLCCSAFCSCCVTAQLMRHTGEYETYHGVCCSETGLPQSAPAVV